MPIEAVAEAYQATGVIPAAPWRVKAVGVLPDWRLTVTFNDGATGIVELAGLVNGPDAGVFAALRDPVFFARVFLDCGAPAWPNGADLAPDAMHRDIRQTGVCRIAD